MLYITELGPSSLSVNDPSTSVSVPPQFAFSITPAGHARMLMGTSHPASSLVNRSTHHSRYRQRRTTLLYLSSGWHWFKDRLGLALAT